MTLLTVPAVLFTKTAVVIAALTGRVAVLRAPAVVGRAPHVLVTIAVTLRLCGTRELTHLIAPSVLRRAPHTLCAVGHARRHLFTAGCVVHRAQVNDRRSVGPEHVGAIVAVERGACWVV